MNLTDAEVIKALECCVRSTSGNDCEKLNCPACKDFGCHYMDSSDRDDSYEALVEGLGKDALDLINRQKAEIEKLKLTITQFFDIARGKQEEVEKLQAMVEREREKYEITMDKLKETLEERADHTEAIKEFDERLIHEIVNRPSKIQSASEEYLCGSAYRQNEIIDIVKELESK